MKVKLYVWDSERENFYLKRTYAVDSFNTLCNMLPKGKLGEITIFDISFFRDSVAIYLLGGYGL